VVEAVELAADAWVFAVQWEPQEEWRVDPRFLELFTDFVAAAAAFRAERSPQPA
jgi:gamma-glutamyl-gamma-aminobutyrate hydrolase PuuD